MPTTILTALSMLIMLLMHGETSQSANANYQLTEEWTLGGEQGDCFGVPLDKVRDVAQAADGTIYVSDGGNSRVLHVSADGACLSQIGSAGEGPGEFVAVGALAVYEGKLYALDTGLRRISVFGPDHAFERHIKVKHRVAEFVPTQEGIWATTYDLRGKTSLVRQYSVDGDVLGAWGQPLESTQAVEQTGTPGRIAVDGGRLLYAFAYPYRIEVFDRQGEKQSHVAIEDAAFQAPTQAQASGGVIMGGTLETSVGKITTAGPGHLLVQVRGTSWNRLDVLDASLAVRASIDLPEGHRLTRAGSERVLYTTVSGGDEFASVTKWRVTRTP
ncbi:MAG: 6-bladed beta-propeller [Bacteroidota bacterium]